MQIIESIKEINTLINLAKKLEKEQKFLDAIDVLARIDQKLLSNELLTEFTLVKAAIYYKMSLQELCFDTLSSVFYNGQVHKQIFVALTFSYIYADEYEMANYYLTQGYSNGWFDSMDEFVNLSNQVCYSFDIDMDDDLDLLDEFDDETKNEKIQLLDTKLENEYGKLLEEGRGMLMQNKFDEAAKIFDKIPTHSTLNYTISRCYLALFCYTTIGDTARAISYMDDSAIDKGHFFAITNRIMFAVDVKDEETFNRLVAEVDNRADSLTLIELKKFILCIEFSTEHALINRYCHKILELDKYDIHTLIYAGISSYNLGDIEQAKEHFITILNIKDDHFVAKTYCKTISVDKEPYQYSIGLQDKEFEKISENIGNLIKLPYGDIYERNEEQIKWYISKICGGIQRELIRRVAQEPKYIEFFKKMILAKTIDRFTKKEMLFNLIINELPLNRLAKEIKNFSKKNIYITVDELLVKLDYAFPKDLFKYNNSIIEGYFNAFATIAFAQIDFAHTFIKKVDKVLLALQSHKDINDGKTVAAILLSHCGKVTSFKRMDVCVEFFGANQANYKLYKKYITDFNAKSKLQANTSNPMLKTTGKVSSKSVDANKDTN